MLVIDIGSALSLRRGVMVPWSVCWPPPSGKRTESSNSMCQVLLCVAFPFVVIFVGSVDFLVFDLLFWSSFGGTYSVQEMTSVSRLCRYESF